MLEALAGLMPAGCTFFMASSQPREKGLRPHTLRSAANSSALITSSAMRAADGLFSKKSADWLPNIGFHQLGRFVMSSSTRLARSLRGIPPRKGDS
jgi:hypothetical protein